MGWLRVNSSRIDADVKSFLGMKFGGAVRDRLYFENFTDPEYGIAYESKKPSNSCFYQPIKVKLADERKVVWINKSSFEKRFSPEQAKRYEKYFVRSRAPKNIPSWLSRITHSAETKALRKKISEFTECPPHLDEVDRLLKCQIQPGQNGIKVGRGNRGRTMIVAPNGNHYICLTRSESDGDRVLGKGSFKKIKVAINRATLETKALAIGRKDEDPNYKNEIKVLQKLKGEAEFVQIDCWAETDEKYYIIMENCNGGDLSKRFEKRTKLTDEQKVTLALDYASGVKKLHDKQIVHGDIKPHNFMLSETANGPRGKIVDLGGSVEANKGRLTGTPESNWDPGVPLNRTADKGVDIWGLGTVFYSLFHPEHQLLPYQNEACGILTSLRNLRQADLNRAIDQRIKNKQIRDLLKGMLTIDRSKRLKAEEVVARLEALKRPSLFQRIQSVFSSFIPAVPRFFSPRALFGFA